jgi:hypothetical protein
MRAPALLPPMSYLPIVLPMPRRIRDALSVDDKVHDEIRLNQQNHSSKLISDHLHLYAGVCIWQDRAAP